MSQFLADLQAMFLLSVEAALLAMATLTLLEYLFPGPNRTSARSRLSGLVLRLSVLAIGAVVQAFLVMVLRHYPAPPLLRVHVVHLLRSDSMAMRVSAWAGLYVTVTLFVEFWLYWFHRLQHMVPFLWGFHRVHHSIRELNAINAADHFSDPVFGTPFAMLPGTFLLGFDNGPWPFALTLLAWFHALYVHSTMRLNFGKLRHILIDTRYHRIHHSLHPAHFDKNFCGHFPLWDFVFRTAYFPARGETVDIGIAGLPSPGFKAFVAIPRSPKLQAELAAPSA